VEVREVGNWHLGAEEISGWSDITLLVHLALDDPATVSFSHVASDRGEGRVSGGISFSQTACKNTERGNNRQAGTDKVHTALQIDKSVCLLVCMYISTSIL
jgi:hypothetical protein